MLLFCNVPRQKFSRWFAWYPVLVPEGWVWCEYVFCYEKEWVDGFDYYYQRLNGERNQNIPK